MWRTAAWSRWTRPTCDPESAEGSPAGRTPHACWGASLTKLRFVFACQACGFESSKWLCRCPECGEWNSFLEERQEATPAAKGRPASPAIGGRPKPYAAVDGTDADRIPSGIDAFDR